MLRVYNYMVIGLAITGLAALGIYMLSVTRTPQPPGRNGVGCRRAIGRPCI